MTSWRATLGRSRSGQPTRPAQRVSPPRRRVPEGEPRRLRRTAHRRKRQRLPARRPCSRHAAAAPGRRQRLGLGAEHQPVSLAEDERAGVGPGQPGLQERHPVVAGQVARMNLEVGEARPRPGSAGGGPRWDGRRPDGRGRGRHRQDDAAACRRVAGGFACLWARGVESEAALGHAALLELLTPVRDRPADLPGSLGRGPGGGAGWSVEERESAGR
jgi:hypothetical protein